MSEQEKFTPKGSFVFFGALIAVFTLLWFALYHLMIKQV